MKRLFSYITMLLLAAPLWAQSADSSGETGEDCEHAIRITQDYSGEMDHAGTYWYKVWTYDLPLRIVYNPTSPVTHAPKAYVDFTCTHDVYPTDELQDMFGTVDSHGKPASAYIVMPFSLDFFSESDGTYSIDIPASYRELMFRNGITEDIWAYVQVDVEAPASVGMEPSTEFRDCVGDAEWLKLNDTLRLGATAEDGEFWVFPITLWRDDSLTFKWSGTEDATLTLHYTCDIDPEEPGLTMLSGFIDIPAGGEYRMSKAEIDELYATYNLFANPQISPIGGLPQGSMEGVFYAYLERSTVGNFVVSKTEPTLLGGATELKIDEAVRADSTQLYCFSTAWNTMNVQFVTPSANSFRMVVAATPFENVTDANVLATYQFDANDQGHVLGLAQAQLQALTNYATTPFLYVRFYSRATTALITPEIWLPSDCEAETITLHPGDEVALTGSNKYQFYRIKASDWCNDSLYINWSGTVALPLFLADTCSLSPLSSSNSHVIVSPTIKRRGTLALGSEDMAEWLTRADGDGYVYFRFNPSGNGTATLISTKAPTPEPEPEPEPETCKETEYKAQVTVEQYCDTLLPYKWQVYEGRELSIAEAGTHYDTIFSYLSDGTTRCDSVIYTLSLDTIHCERPAPEPPSTGGGEEEGEEGDGEGDGDEGEGEAGETGGSGSTGGSGEGGSTGGGSETGGGETGGNQNTPNPPTPGPGFPEPNYPTGSVIYRGAQTISAVCVANAGNVTGAADGIVEVRVTKAQELRLMQGSAELERWMQQPGEVHRLTLREGVTYTLRGLETLYLRR